uniref:Ig-like domain-containing protein n=1 Tax=Oncorhynchus mykiss TaxID=8022 RepID=A0A8C7TPM1_ONCMY
CKQLLEKLLVSCTKGEDSVIQSPGDLTATEGEQVTLGCQFDTVDGNPYLFWYKQRANDFPKYMLKRATFGSDNAIEFQRRFDAHLNLTTFKSESKSVPLTIQRLQLSDSAVYYCALRPTVTTGYTWDTIMKWNDSYWIFQTFLTNQKLKNWACKIIQPP